MLMESKTAYFILIAFPTPFHPVKASETEDSECKTSSAMNKEKQAEKHLKEDLIKK